MTGVPISDPGDRGASSTAFPGAMLGVKDSACDAPATMRLIEAMATSTILVGDETYLGRACAAGAGGSICGVAQHGCRRRSIASPRPAGTIRGSSPSSRRSAAHPIIPMVKALVAPMHERRRPGRAPARRSPPARPRLKDVALSLAAFREPAKAAA